MRHPVSRELFAYWDLLRAGRSAPERSAIDPAAIRDLLAYTFLLEVGPADWAGSRAVSFRLSGTRLNALFHRDLKGGAFAGLWAARDETEASALVDTVLDECAPVVAGARGHPTGYEAADFEVLLLPLRHHGRTHARVLGSIAAETVPSWIGLRPIEGLRLASFRTVLPRDGGRLGSFGAAAEDAEAAVPRLLVRPLALSRNPAGAKPGSAAASAPRSAGSGGKPTPPFRVFQGGRASPNGTTSDLG